MDTGTENRQYPRPEADGESGGATGNNAGGGPGVAAGSATRGLFGRVVAGVLTLLLFGAALMFSLLLFGVVLCLGALAWGYLWWKTRHARRALSRQPFAPPPEGRIIEGEVIERTRTPDDTAR